MYIVAYFHFMNTLLRLFLYNWSKVSYFVTLRDVPFKVLFYDNQKNVEKVYLSNKTNPESFFKDTKRSSMFCLCYSFFYVRSW